ncbi:MAG: isoprenylcysteine carboxylmethyltransferase family protein [Microthrixaceae bacterium]|nr:isoprenylcysteine carboxylmethyltransferase family protein [Microthrixaceae bacterium]
MTVTALAIFVIWMALTFGARTALALRRTGDSGLRKVSASPLSTEWWAAVLMVGALLSALAAPILDLAGLDPLVESNALSVTGLLIAVVGVTSTLAAQLAMGDSWRVGVDKAERTSLVTGGVFRFVRNPIFTAMVTTAFGLTLMVPNVVVLAGFLMLGVALELQVRCVEEPYLRRTHGADYQRYAGEVGRFIPGIGRLRS